MILKGVMVCRAGTPTPTGKIYSLKILREQAEVLRDNVSGRGMFGELGPVQSSIVHIANVSHLVTRLEVEGDCLVVDIETLATPAGKTLENVLSVNKNMVDFWMVGVGGGRVDEKYEGCDYDYTDDVPYHSG